MYCSILSIYLLMISSGYLPGFLETVFNPLDLSHFYIQPWFLKKLGQIQKKFKGAILGAVLLNFFKLLNLHFCIAS